MGRPLSPSEQPHHRMRRGPWVAPGWVGAASHSQCLSLQVCTWWNPGASHPARKAGGMKENRGREAQGGSVGNIRQNPRAALKPEGSETLPKPSPARSLPSPKGLRPWSPPPGHAGGRGPRSPQPASPSPDPAPPNPHLAACSGAAGPTSDQSLGGWS